MIRGIIEISLAVALALPLSVCGAKAGTVTAQRQQPVEKTLVMLDGLQERVRLNRAVTEFAEEFSMFDNQLYGHVDKPEDKQEQLSELNAVIREKNGRLQEIITLLNNDRDGYGFAGSWVENTGDGYREIMQEMSSLTSELASMQGQMNTLLMTNLLPGENLVLEASHWDGLFAGEAIRNILELVDSSLEEMQNLKDRQQ